MVLARTKIPISAVVASCDEAELLEDCLRSLQFCDEVVLIDMESSDKTVEIGQKYGCEIHSIKRVPVVEEARLYISDKTKYNWILFVDPDERVQDELADQIADWFRSPEVKTCSKLNLPWQFFYKNQLLRGTIWGGNKVYKGALVHKNRVSFSKDVHRDLVPLEGFSVAKLQRNGENYIKHLWMQKWQDLVRKHRRYLEQEGASMFNAGVRYSFKHGITAGYLGFKRSFINEGGYKDGFLGFRLSLFWGWYCHKKWQVLKKYEDGK